MKHENDIFDNKWFDLFIITVAVIFLNGYEKHIYLLFLITELVFIYLNLLKYGATWFVLVLYMLFAFYFKCYVLLLLMILITLSMTYNI